MNQLNPTRFYVYMYVDPRTGTPFYVGKGTGPRVNVHLKETSKNTKNRRKFNRIQELLALGLKPTIIYHTVNLEESDALLLETSLIKHYGRMYLDVGGVLTNVLDNPNATSVEIKENTRKLMSAIAKERLKNPKNHPAYGKKSSEETRMRLRESHLGKTHSEETKRRMSETHKLKCLEDPSLVERMTNANYGNKYTLGRRPWNYGKRKCQQ